MRLGDDLLISSFMDFLLQMEEFRFGDWVSWDKQTHAPQVSLGLIAVGVLVLLCLTVAAVGGGVFWNRKKKSIGVVTLHKVRVLRKL